MIMESLLNTQDNNLTMNRATVAMVRPKFRYLSLGLASPNSGWSMSAMKEGFLNNAHFKFYTNYQPIQCYMI